MSDVLDSAFITGSARQAPGDKLHGGAGLLEQQTPPRQPLRWQLLQLPPTPAASRTRPAWPPLPRSQAAATTEQDAGARVALEFDCLGIPEAGANISGDRHRRAAAAALALPWQEADAGGSRSLSHMVVEEFQTPAVGLNPGALKSSAGVPESGGVGQQREATGEQLSAMGSDELTRLLEGGVKRAATPGPEEVPGGVEFSGASLGWGHDRHSKRQFARAAPGLQRNWPGPSSADEDLAAVLEACSMRRT